MERKNNAIAITGISGSGKGFLIDKAIGESKNINVFNTNRLLKELVDSEGIDVSSLASDFSLDRQTDKISQDLNISLDTNLDKVGILDTHMTHKRDGKIISDDRLIKNIFPNNITLVESDPEEILNRRINDRHERNRIIEPIDSIRYHQDQEKFAAIKASKELGIPTLFISNNFQNTEYNINYFKSIISSLSLNKVMVSGGEGILDNTDIGLFLLKNPNSIIPYGDSPHINMANDLEELILSKIDNTKSEFDCVSRIYSLLCSYCAYDEQFYLNFNNPLKLTNIYQQHMSNIGVSNKGTGVICNDFSILLAELTKKFTGKKGFLDSNLVKGVGGVIPHTRYVVDLKDSNGIIKNYIFDSTESFANSDLLRVRLNVKLDINMSQEEIKLFDDKIYSFLISSCSDTGDLNRIISSFMYLPVVERSSFIKNVVKEYASCFKVGSAFNRFSYRLGDKQYLACIFNILENNEKRNFIVAGNNFNEISHSFQSKLESNGDLTCISKVRQKL